MTNTKLPAHPFAQIAIADIEQVNGGIITQGPDLKSVTLAIPEDGISYVFDENGFTTMAIGEEGGQDLPATF